MKIFEVIPIRARVVALAVGLIGLGSVFTPCESLGTEPDDSAVRIERVENGLIPPQPKGQSPKPVSVAERMKQLGVPGMSVTVIDESRIVWAKGYGVLEAGRPDPVTPETMFQVASISKPLAAVAALRLVQARKLKLDGDVNELLKAWKVPDSPLLATEKEATGQPFARHLREVILDTPAMEHSTFEQPLPQKLAPRAASGHRSGLGRIVRGEKIEGGSLVYPELAAAGLWTTPTDLARFAIAIQRAHAGVPKAIPSRATAEEMLTPQGKVGRWGLGFDLGGRGEAAQFRHGGGNEGFKCALLAFKESGRGAVIMTNSDNGVALGMELLRSISAEYGWPKLNQSARVMTGGSRRLT